MRFVFFLTLVTVMGAGDSGAVVAAATALVLDAPQSGTSTLPLDGGVCEFLADLVASGIAPILSMT